MKFGYFRKLNKNERYPTTKKYLKSMFSGLETLEVSFGLYRNFQFDSRLFHKPKIKGNVVASISYRRDRTIDFSLFPLSITEYPEEAADDFNSRTLYVVKQWIEAQINKPDAALLGIEELVVEWYGNEHLFHKTKFL